MTPPPFYFLKRKVCVSDYQKLFSTILIYIALVFSIKIWSYKKFHIDHLNLLEADEVPPFNEWFCSRLPFFMETLGDKKVVSSLGWAGEAYNPSHSVARKAFSCTHSQIRWPGNTNCHTTSQEIFERYLSSPTGFANSQLFFPDTTPKYTPLASATHSVRFWMGDSKPPPPSNTPILKSCHFGKLRRPRASHCTRGNLRAKKSRLVKRHTLI